MKTKSSISSSKTLKLNDNHAPTNNVIKPMIEKSNLPLFIKKP